MRRVSLRMKSLGEGVKLKCTKEDLLLYAVTDRSWVHKSSLEEQVKEALEGGVTCLQLREKHLLKEDFIKEVYHSLLMMW